MKLIKILKKHAKKCAKILQAKWHALAQLISENKIASLHTALLVFLVIRVESLHSKINAIAAGLEQAFQAIVQVSGMLFINIIAAAERFDDAIQSILALFNGSNS